VSVSRTKDTAAANATVSRVTIIIATKRSGKRSFSRCSVGIHMCLTVTLTRKWRWGIAVMCRGGSTEADAGAGKRTVTRSTASATIREFLVEISVSVWIVEITVRERNF
jgi:hypothetical protein